MKKLIYTVVLSFLCSLGAFAQFNIGVGAIYFTEGSELGVQAKAMLLVQEKWKFSPAVNYYLTNGINFGFDADVHYELFTVADNVNIALMGGLNWTKYGEGIDPDIGINIGVISDFTVKDGSLHFYLEPKLLFIGDSSGFVITTGILL